MSTIVERMIDGEAWWVDPSTGKTYGLVRVIPESDARAKQARRQAYAAKVAANPRTPPEEHTGQTCSQALAPDGWTWPKPHPVSAPPPAKGLAQPGRSAAPPRCWRPRCPRARPARARSTSSPGPGLTGTRDPVIRR